MSTTATFHCTIADVKVTPIGKFVEDREPHPFKVCIIPFSILLPSDTIVVNEPYYFCAAGEALDQYKAKHGLNPTEIWTFER